MSTIIYETITGNWSMAELAAMYLNEEITVDEYIEWTKNPTEAPEIRESTEK